MLNNQEKELILLEDLGYMYPNKTSKQKAKYGIYKCGYCGNEFKTQTQRVRNGATVSCGCKKGNIKHYLSYHRLYAVWNGMIRRCNNKNDRAYKNYGGRGISVCNRWLIVENFIEDMYPTYQLGLTIDRINTYGNYEPSNCRWTNQSVQMRNTRKLKTTNISGYRGVSFFKERNKWIATICVNYKKIYLGIFKESKDAAYAYDNYVIDNNLEHTRNFE